MTDAELMAILIGSGMPSVSAVDLSRYILFSGYNSLAVLARLTVKDHQKFRGIGKTKTIASTLELGRRRKLLDTPKQPIVTGSGKAYERIPYY